MTDEPAAGVVDTTPTEQAVSLSGVYQTYGKVEALRDVHLMSPPDG